MKNQQYLSITDACEFTTMSRKTLDYAKDRGDLPYIRKGRRVVFRVSDLVSWMERGLVDASKDIRDMGL